MKRFFTASILALLMMLSAEMKATHIVGGELYYDYLGNNKYKVTMKLYSDCLNGSSIAIAYDSIAIIGVFNSSNVSVMIDTIKRLSYTVVPIPLNPCYTNPNTVCVAEAYYIDTITLPPLTGGYTLSYQRCCRNNSILNLNLPGDQGATYFSHIPDPTVVTQNSIAHFNNYPPIFLCNGNAFSYDHSAFDPDGDSLVYQLCSPYQGLTATNPGPVQPTAPPYTSVTYVSPYNSSNQMSGAPPLAIDQNTGLLTITPNMIGPWVVGICVSEYRNGVFVCSHVRDFQFNVLNCPPVVVASVPSTVSKCIGKYITFQNNSDTSGVHPVPFTWHWDFGVTSLTNDTSKLFNPLPYNYPDTGVYVVKLVVNPGTACSDTGYATIGVYPPIYVDFNAPASQCFTGNSYNFLSIDTLGAKATYAWTFPNATPTTATVKNPSGISFNAAGTYTVTMIAVDHGCTDTTKDVITVFPSPIADFSYTPKTECAPYTATFSDSSSVSSGPLTYLWDFGHGLSSTQPSPSVFFSYENKGVQNGSLTVTTDKGCTDFKNFIINDSTCDITVPNVFSPNNDGKNDKFVIKNLEHYPKSRLVIYDRWGIKLYESADYQNDWNGERASDGTYYFILYVVDGRTIPGYLTLLRHKD